MTSNQTELFESANLQSTAPVHEVRENRSRWLGLATNHRQLFEALQDDWLRPDEEDAGWLLGVQAYAPAVAKASEASSKHAIRTLIELDIDRLPRVGVMIYPGSYWVPASLDDEVPSRTPLFWPGALPTFAIRNLTVGTQEERARLLGLAGQISNIQLPDQLVTVDAAGGALLKRIEPPSDAEERLLLPPEEDAMRGAMSMAIWAVPRIDPWLDLLVAGLRDDWENREKAALEVEADWWKYAPWDRRRKSAGATDPQTRLWLAAIDVFAAAEGMDDMTAHDLALRIADAALRNSADSREIERWKLLTQRILSGHAAVSLGQADGDWRATAVGCAIQLVLARPDPAAFITWCKDMSDMPPAVWWSGAALCGLLRGYRRMDVRFRGSVEQREALAVRALQICNGNSTAVRWLNDEDKPSWRSQAGGEPSFSLDWGAQQIAHLRMRARGAWYNADLSDARVLHAAKSVAETLKWRECWYEELEISPGEVPVEGEGKVRILGDRIEVQDQPVRIRVPLSSSRRKCLDTRSFRRLVAIERGLLPPPPSVRGLSDWLGIPGLTFRSDFLGEEEEEELIGHIDSGVWRQDLKRRVQHYGWKYDYRARKVHRDMRLGPLPDWADGLARRLVEQGLVSQHPDQLIVNEYVGAQGIRKHIDSQDSFADGIAMISLGESWQMVFRLGKRKEVGTLNRRSVVVVKGDARYRWTHEIAARKYEPGPPRRKRGRRISLTFRKVIPGSATRKAGRSNRRRRGVDRG